MKVTCAMFFWLVCELSPVLRLSLETDTLPVSAVALPLSLVLLPYTAGQLSSHHHAVTLLQGGTDWHHLCCGRSVSDLSLLLVDRSYSLVMKLFVHGNRDAPAGCISWCPLPLSFSLFVSSMSGLGTFIDVLLLFPIHVVTLQSVCTDIRHQLLHVSFPESWKPP